MILKLARRLRHSDDESGLTLIEILIASALGLLLMTAVAAMFIQTTKVTNFSLQNRNSTSIAANAMQEISEVVRLATPIAVSGSTTATPAVVSATAKTLVIYSLVDVTDTTNPAPSRVTLDTTSGSLVDTRCVGKLVSGFWTFSTCASTSTRTIAGTFVAPTSPQLPLFTYRNSTGGTLALSGSSLPAASIPLVASITVSVNLLAPGSKNNPVYLQGVVGMPNVGLQQETS